MGVRGKCISPRESRDNADGRVQETKTEQFCRQRPNKFIQQKELYHDRPNTETSHTRYYAELRLYCDIFTRSSIRVNVFFIQHLPYDKFCEFPVISAYAPVNNHNFPGSLFCAKQARLRPPSLRGNGIRSAGSRLICAGTTRSNCFRNHSRASRYFWNSLPSWSEKAM